MRLYLASESPRRKELLKELAAEFTVEGADVEEISSKSGLAPAAVAMVNARMKAAAVALKHPEDWIVAADTIVELAGNVYGKPRDLVHAAKMLREFSGKAHKVITAVVVCCCIENKRSEFTAETTVRFRNLSEQDIACYLSQVPVLDKAGSYGIQEKGEILVESIEGELTNVIGLPVKALTCEMEKLGILGKF